MRTKQAVSVRFQDPEAAGVNDTSGADDGNAVSPSGARVFRILPENQLMEAKRKEHPTSNRFFSPTIDLNGVPVIICARDTVAFHLFGPVGAGVVHRFSKNRNAVLYVTTYVCILPAYTTLFGVIDDAFGFLSLTAIFVAIANCLVLNVHLLSVLLRSYDFWLLFMLAAVGTGGFIDAYRASPGRLSFFVAGWLNLFCASVYDARQSKLPPLKQGNVVILVMIVDSLMLFFFILFFYLGKLSDLQQRLVPMGGEIVLDVQSIAANCLTTHCLLRLRYLGQLYSNPNALLIIRPTAAMTFLPMVDEEVGSAN